MRDIGKNIKDLRIQKKLTQDELAEKLFVTRQTVSNYETGRSRPDIDMLMRIAEVLETDLNSLLYESEDAAHRRKQLLLTAAAAAVMTILGIGLYWLKTHVIRADPSTYRPELDIFASMVLQPGYDFLLGWLITACAIKLKYLQPPKPKTAKILKWTVLALVFLLILVLFPYYSVMLGRLGLPYIRITGLWLTITHFITENRAFLWLALLLGLVFGLCVQPKKA